MDAISQLSTVAEGAISADIILLLAILVEVEVVVIQLVAASVRVTVYVPAVKLDIIGVVAALLHE
jgi:hypothetical protein